MKIKKLANLIIRNGFKYKLIERNDKAVIYEQGEKDKEETTNHWEVFKIKTTDYRKAMERLALKSGKAFNPSDYEELSERFPCDEAFGKWAWSFTSYAKAHAKFIEVSA